MKQSIQDKVDEIIKMATTPVPLQRKISDIQRDDSLAKIIRTQEDADRFMADLDAAVAMAKRRAQRAD